MGTVQQVGKFRLVHLDYNDNTLSTLTEKNAYEFAVGTTAPTDRQTQPSIDIRHSPVLKEDDKLAVFVKMDTAVTEAASTNATFTWSIPITFKNLRTGNKFKQTLSYSDFTTTGCEVPTNGKVWATGKWYKLGYYQIPAQSAIKLGHDVQDVRVDSKIIIHNIFTT